MNFELDKLDRIAMAIFASTGKMEEVMRNRSVLLDGLEKTRSPREDLLLHCRRDQIGKPITAHMAEGPRQYESLTNAECEEVVRFQVDSELGSAIGTLDAAAIVFCHSVFEELIHAIFDLDFKENPGSWEEELGKRSIEVSSALSMSASDIRRLAWERIRQDIARKHSLEKNVNWLADRCKRANSAEYEYIRKWRKIDFGRIAYVDEFRHKLIHQPQRAAPIIEVEEILFFLWRTTQCMAELSMNCLFGLSMRMNGLNAMGSR